MRLAYKAENGMICDSDTILPIDLFNAAFQTLKNKGMAKGAVSPEEGQSLLFLTAYGKAYLERYPHLRNPIRWRELAWWIGTALAALPYLCDLFDLLSRSISHLR